ncbi:FAD-dependent monooxygenase [Antrihabitans stalactiti]|uniref:Aromatic ring hydroxylase n=1 Tax=Antrihabitans stalactiti TaxID=2584121 RepID=A0A848KC41_9NOCA|nr:FAD-dependent monooxygenase [Antrihabitans stalactiti]NMN95256.1 aromatic ring hydroxylase [Antrihabitans stalactiti]
MTKSAAIIGGGIGGLATANYLVQHGWIVDVFERSAALPDTGTALGMWPEALVALDAIGVGDRVRSIGSQQKHGLFRRADGSTLAKIDIRDTAVLISRPRLLESLASTLPDGIVKFSTTIDNVADLGGYDVIVGADGVNSRVRTAVVGHQVDPEFLGFSALIGRAHGTTDTVAETWDEEKIFGISPRDGGVTNWFAAYRQPADGRMPADPMAFLRSNFGHWHSDVTELLDRIDTNSFIHYNVKQMPKLDSYVRGNIALIGDSAHAMAPNLGRGACETLIDAATLGQALVSHDVDEALRRYDRKRRKHTQRLLTGARLMSKAAMSTRFNGPRDAAIRVVSKFA